MMNFIFPTSIYCIECGAIISKDVEYSLCHKCIKKFHWITDEICIKCGRLLENNHMFEECNDCRTKTHTFEKGYVCAKYGLYERTLIMDYKYGNMPYLGKIIGSIMAERILIEKIDINVVIPVPIHKTRKIDRGYNQSEILASVIAHKLDIVCYKKAIMRKKETIPMKSLDSVQRERNVAEAFSINNNYNERIKGKTILIVDDIYTTGSTINSVAKALTEFEPKHIYFTAFAAGKN